jgi:hypothetical protein
MVVESYVFIGRTVGVNCEQMMEFTPKNQKGKPCEKDLPLLKNDITKRLRPQKRVIYSRNNHNYCFVISYYGITKKSGH